MAKLTYDDFKSRLSIHDVLHDAGYVRSPRDGVRYPVYVRLDSDGRRVRGDKFIVTANGVCCFQPPTQRNYNIIGFIKEHPEMFRDYTPGMDKDRLVNLVCNRLLNNPVDERVSYSYAAHEREAKPFNIEAYSLHRFDKDDWASQKRFYPFFRQRGIDLGTQYAFREHFVLATHSSAEGHKFTNLSFPLQVPGKEGIVGFEERGLPNKEGKAYKGKAEGSNGSEGLWIANLSGKPLAEATDVLWFESAYDAMAYHLLAWNRDGGPTSVVFVSTGGNPTVNQFKGMLRETKQAIHHICFDRDAAGQAFAHNLCNYAKGDAELPKVKIIAPEMEEYLRSVKRRDNLESGDFELLNGELGALHGKYFDAGQEAYEMTRSPFVHPDDKVPIKQAAMDAHKAFYEAFHEAVGTSDNLRIIREEPKVPYKDWNEDLLAEIHKRQEEAQEQTTEEEQENEEEARPRFRR